MKEVYYTYFVDDINQPTKVRLMITPMPTDWVDGFSPLTRIAIRLSNYGQVAIDERQYNVITVTLIKGGWSCLSSMMYAFRHVMCECFGLDIKYIDTKTCEHYNTACECTQ